MRAWLASRYPKEGDATETRAGRIERVAKTMECEPDYGLPEIGPLEYLVEYLISSGEVSYNGGYMTALGWDDIASWSVLCGASLEPREVEAMRRLSLAYVSEYYASDLKNTEPPYKRAFPGREAIAKKAQQFIAMLRS